MNDVITRAEMAGSPFTDESVIKQKTDFNAEWDPIRQSLRELGKPMPEALQRCVTEIKSEMEKYFQRFGVENIQWPEIVYTDKKLDFVEPGLDGIALPGIVVITDVGEHEFIQRLKNSKSQTEHPLTPQEEENYKNIGLSYSLAHELFHSTSPTIIVESIAKANKIAKFFGKKDKIAFNIDRTGLRYPKNKKHDDGDSIEEGLAMLAQFGMDYVIEKHFPSEMKFFKEARIEALRAMDDNRIPIESVGPTFDPPITYPDNTNLTKELMENVPDFENLAVRARVKHETLTLAKAIEKIYGVGSYRQIMLSTEMTAHKTLNSLLNRRDQTTKAYA